MAPINPPVMLSRTNGRDNNEDAFLSFSFQFSDGTPAWLLLVSDGMGGHEHGERFSRETTKKFASLLIETLVLHPSINQSIYPTFVPEEMPAKIWQVVQLTWQHIQRMMASNHWEQGGATLVLALVTPCGSWAVNIGDSPLFHYQVKEQLLIEVSDDHSVAGILLKKGLITPQLARFHEGRHRLEYYMGQANLPKSPCVKALNLSKGDILLLCSDGVNNTFTSEELCERLRQAPDNLKAWSEDLFDEGVKRGETDNQTLICWKIPPEFACITPEVAGQVSEENVRVNEPLQSVSPLVSSTPEVVPQSNLAYSQFLQTSLIPLPAGEFTLPELPLDRPEWFLPFDGKELAPLTEKGSISEGLYLMKTPVTWEHCFKITPNSSAEGHNKRSPATSLNIILIKTFISKLNELDQLYNYRLPNEWEWLVASYNLTFPLNLSQVWCAENASGQLQPVASRAELENGYYDLFGNVWELMTQEMSDSKFVIRGGAYDTPLALCHPALRFSVLGSLNSSSIGFRLIAEMKEPLK